MKTQVPPQRWVEDYQRIEQAITFLEKNFQTQPTLGEVARSVHLSEFHFQRLFRRWAGISPKRFLQFLTVQHAKELLAESQSVLDTCLDSGLSGPGRLHDLFVNLEAVSPGEFQNGAADLKIQYGFHPTPFGMCLLGTTARGICGLRFLVNDDAESALRDLQATWPRATLVEDSERTGSTAHALFAGAIGSAKRPLTLLVRGTNFQVKVWEALLRIPPGFVLSYHDVARQIGCPAASRAVGQAVGANPIGYLIPCHRVIRSMGVFGHYGWGPARKKAMLVREMARRTVAEC